MCTNYKPISPENALQLQLAEPPFDYVDEAYPASLCPIIVAGANVSFAWRQAMFGLVPEWADDLSFSQYTYNARTETVATKPSFKAAWAKRQFALVPMRSFYEPCYESGKSVRFKIARHDQQPFTVAAIWDVWSDHLHTVCSFSLLTMNADRHPLMKRFHRPKDEKRSIVIVPAESRMDWLHGDHRMARSLIQEVPVDEFYTEAAPRISEAKKHNLDLF